MLLVFLLACWGPRKTYSTKKKEATDAYANWIYITIAHSVPSPMKGEGTPQAVYIYTMGRRPPLSSSEYLFEIS